MKTNLILPNQLPKTPTTYKPTTIASKQIADTIEALIGMFLLNTGFIPAKDFIQKLGINITTVNKINYPIITSVSQLEKTCDSQYLWRSFNLSKLENTLNYTFHNKFLLLVSVYNIKSKHLKDLNISVTPQHRLKFVGNAIIDFLISYEIYKNAKQQRISPGYLTELRSSLISRQVLGRLAIEIGLDRHIFDPHGLKDATVTKLVKQFVREYSRFDRATKSWQSQFHAQTIAQLIRINCRSYLFRFRQANQLQFEKFENGLEHD